MSVFDTINSRSIEALKRVMGQPATLTYASDGTTISVTICYLEFVGAVDDNRRAIFTVATADFNGTIPDRGDYFVLDNETDRWTVIDVRDDKAGSIELRCDGRGGRL